MMQQRREICVGKRKTRDNLRTIGRDDALFGRGRKAGEEDGEEGVGVRKNIGEGRKSWRKLWKGVINVDKKIGDRGVERVRRYRDKLCSRRRNL